MVVTKRLSCSSDSTDSNGETMPSSPLKRMHDDDVSGMEPMLRRENQLKTTIPFVSSPVSMMIWTKTDDLVILGGIVDYQNEKGSSYKSDCDAFYSYIKDSIEANFSKKQLFDKIKKLKKMFTDNLARSNDGKGLSFTDNDDDDDIFKLSMIIWGTNEITDSVSNEIMDQAEVVVSNKDGSDEEHERVSNMDEAKVHVFNEDVTSELVSSITLEIDNGEKKKSKEEEDNVDESCVLRDALEATPWFRSFGKYGKKLLLQNLKNLEAETRKDLTDECNALLVEELQLYIKKRIFFVKLADLGVSD